jgi:DNA-binding transcriptional LysR family regulator
VSQQIRRLEEALGRPLLVRDSKPVVPTEEGERLLAYARRILALAEEARDVVARPASEGAIRLGLAEDFAAYRLSEMLSQFARARPGLRLDVRCGLSVRLRHDVEHGELDLALLKSNAGEGDRMAAWPERLRWVGSRRHPIDLARDPLPLAVFEQGCLYRNRAIHTLEAAQRRWHIAYTSANLTGIQAAVSAGLGISILADVAILDDHVVLGPDHGLPAITDTELALVVAADASSATRRLAAALVDFCNASDPRLAA